MKNLRNSDEAVVGIVVTVLLIGLIVSVLVMINTVYVPNWVEKQESDHMDQVLTQFTHLKYALDIQSIVNDTTSISTHITLGSREIPFFDSGRTYGILTITPQDCMISINFTNNGLLQTKQIISDTIEYSSKNTYFVDQSYIYQAGALILSQDESDVLIGNPSIIVTKPNSIKNITMTVVDIAGVEEKSYSAGFGSYAITTQVYNPSQEYLKLSNVSSIIIETNYPNSWNTSFQRSFQQQGLAINYTTSMTSSKLIMNIHPDALMGYTYDLYLKEVDITTEIGYGFSNS